jgi:hypothetical protein
VDPPDDGREMRAAAARPQDVPTTSRLVQYIYIWETGAYHKPSTRYQLLYCQAFSLTRHELFTDSTETPGSARGISDAELIRRYNDGQSLHQIAADVSKS